MPNLNVDVPEPLYQKMLEEKKQMEKKIGGKITWSKYLETKFAQKDDMTVKTEILKAINSEIIRLYSINVKNDVIDNLKGLMYGIIFDEKGEIKGALENLQKLLLQ